jgi:hypothetical protein
VESSEITFYHQHEGDQIWWGEKPDQLDGEYLFSFDRVTVFDLFADYPWSLTEEQRRIFDRENPEWRDFFKNRK